MGNEEKAKEEGLELEAIVVEAVRGNFRLQIVDPGKQIDSEKPGHEVLAHLAGKLRKHMNNIKIVPGDRVKVEVSPYDLTRGRITFRMKD